MQEPEALLGSHHMHGRGVSLGLAQYKPSLGAEKCAQKAPKSVTFSGSAYSVKEPRHGGKCHVRHVRAGAGGT